MGVYLFLIFVFLIALFCVTQDGEAVEKEKNRRLVWSRPKKVFIDNCKSLICSFSELYSFI